MKVKDGLADVRTFRLTHRGYQMLTSTHTHARTAWLLNAYVGGIKVRLLLRKGRKRKVQGF